MCTKRTSDSKRLYEVEMSFDFSPFFFFIYYFLYLFIYLFIYFFVSFPVGANSRASKSWVDSMVKQVLGNLQRGAPLAQAGGMSNGMVSRQDRYKLYMR